MQTALPSRQQSRTCAGGCSGAASSSRQLVPSGSSAAPMRGALAVLRPMPSSSRTLVQVRQAAAAASAPLGGLGMLQNTRPIDRLRFQALLLFKQVDVDADGKLGAEDLQRYRAYCEERFGSPANAMLAPAYDAAASEAAASPSGAIDAERFIELVRAQVGALSLSKPYLQAHHKDADLARLTYKTALGPKELGAAFAVFQLLDYDNDKYLRLGELRKATGIEREIVEDQLEEADTNDDGFLNFEDFLASYAKEKPVVLNIVVLLAHTGLYYLILNLPIDFTMRCIACALVLMRPQVVTGAAIRVYQIGRAIWDRIRVEIAMAQQGGKSA